MFTTQDIATEDSQRAIAELRQERDAALAQKAALAEVLGVINRSPGDPQPVFEAILDKARLLCGAEMGALQDWDGEYIRVLARYGYSEDVQALLTPLRQPARPGLGQQPVLLGERFAHVLDATKVEIRADEDEGARNFIERSGTRTWLAVPLRANDALIGFITVARGVVRAFTEAEIVMLEGLAAQAVIAMENARLLGELQQRTADLQELLDYQTATSDVLKAISRAAYDLDTVLNMLIATAVRLCGATHGHLWRRDGEVFCRAASHMNVPAYLQQIRAGRGSLIGRVMIELRPVRIADAWNDPEYEDKEGARLYQRRSMLGVPLLRDGELIGAFSLGRPVPVLFTDRQVELVRTFADQAVIAMENARLLTEQREALEQQTATTEVLQVINAHPANSARSSRPCSICAMRLCEAVFGELHTFDGENFNSAALLGVPAAYAEARKSTPRASVRVHWQAPARRSEYPAHNRPQGGGNHPERRP